MRQKLWKTGVMMAVAGLMLASAIVGWIITAHFKRSAPAESASSGAERLGASA